MTSGRKLALFGIVVVFLGASVFAFLRGAKVQKSRSDDNRASIKQMGFPTTLAEYNATYPWDAKDDALPIYKKYADAVSRLRGGRAVGYKDLTDSDATSKVPAIVLQEGKDLSDLVEILIEGSNKKYWGQASLVTPEYEEEVLWQGVPMLVHLAMAKESAGNLKEALDLLGAANRIQKQSFDPGLGLGLEAGTTNILGQLLRNHENDSAAIQQIIDFMKSNYKPFDFRRDLELNFVSALESETAEAPAGVKANPVQNLKYKTVTRPQFTHQDQLEMAMWKRAFAKLPTNRYDWKGTEDAMVAAMVTNEDRTVAASDMSSFGSCASVLSVYATNIAQRKLVMTAARLLLEKARTGSLPKKLFDDPTFPDHMELSDLSDIDPFTGKPFDYFPTATGFRLHTVGRRGRNMNAIY